MTSGMVRVDFAQLSAAVAEIGQSADRIDARLAALDEQLQALPGDWTGAASSAYQAAKQQWERSMAEMHQLLAHMGQGVFDSNEDFQVTERANEAMFGG